MSLGPEHGVHCQKRIRGYHVECHCDEKPKTVPFVDYRNGVRHILGEAKVVDVENGLSVEVTFNNPEDAKRFGLGGFSVGEFSIAEESKCVDPS